EIGVSAVTEPGTENIEERAEELIAERLSAVPEEDRRQILTDIIRAEAAAALGHADADTVEAGSAFFEIGFISLTAVELRNRLNEKSGLQLPAMLIFDYPTPELVADFLLGLLTIPDRRVKEDV